MRHLAALVLVGAGLLAVAVGGSRLLSERAEPVETAVADVDPLRDPPGGRVRLTGGQVDLREAALAFQDGEIVEAWLPLRAVGEPAAARVVVVSRSVDLLQAYRSPAGEVTRRLEPVGILVPAWDVKGDDRLRLVRLQQVTGAQPMVLRADGAAGSSGAWLSLIVGLAMLLGSALVIAVHVPPPAAVKATPSRRRPTTPSRPLAVPTEERIPLEEITPPETVVAPSPPGTPSGEEVSVFDRDPLGGPDLSARTAVGLFVDDGLETTTGSEAEPAAGRATEPLAEVSPFEDAGEPLPEDDEEAEAGPLLRDADEAEVRRRLVDYSSVATVGHDELLRRFRFVAQKIVRLDEGIRVFGFSGRPREVRWSDIRGLHAYRCPELTPWHSLLVVELLLATSVRPSSPVRLVSRTGFDLGEDSPDVVRGANDLLRSFLRDLVVLAPGLDLGDDERAFIARGREPARYESLRRLAEHDARWPG